MSLLELKILISKEINYAKRNKWNLKGHKLHLFFNAPNSSRMVLNGSYSFFKKKLDKNWFQEKPKSNLIKITSKGFFQICLKVFSWSFSKVCGLKLFIFLF